MQNGISLLLRLKQFQAGITARRAVEGTGQRSWKKRMPPGKPVDRA